MTMLSNTVVVKPKLCTCPKSELETWTRTFGGLERHLLRVSVLGNDASRQAHPPTSIGLCRLLRRGNGAESDVPGFLSSFPTLPSLHSNSQPTKRHRRSSTRRAVGKHVSVLSRSRPPHSPGCKPVEPITINESYLRAFLICCRISA